MPRILLADGTEAQVTDQAGIDAAVSAGGMLLPDSTATGQPRPGVAEQVYDFISAPTDIALQVAGGAGQAVMDTVFSAEEAAYNDPLGAATAAARGFTENVVPGGRTLMSNVGELATQLTDSNDYWNSAEDAVHNHELARTAGGAAGVAWGLPLGFGSVGSGALGSLGGAVLGNALEGGMYGAIEAGAEAYSEDMLQNPEMTSEMMAAHALGRSLRGGGIGAAVAGGGTLLLGGGALAAGRALSATGRGANAIRAAMVGVSDDAVEIAVRELGDSSRAARRAAASIDADPLSPIAQAVRRVEQEGAEAVSMRIQDSVTDDVERIASELEPLLGSAAIRRASQGADVSGVGDTQRAAFDAALAHVSEARAQIGTFRPVNAADREAEAVLRMLDGSLSGTQGPGLGQHASLVDALQSLNRVSQGATPPFAEAARRVMDAIRPISTDTATFGRAAEVAKSSSLLRNMLADLDVPETRTPEALDAVANAIEQHGALLGTNLSRISTGLRSASDKVRFVARAVSVSNELAALRSNPSFLHSMGRSAERWGVRAGGYAVGGVPGAMVAELGYKAMREAGSKRQMIWAAQNAYEQYVKRSGEAIFSFVRHPRPSVAHVQFSDLDYRQAVDAVKRAADIPVAAAPAGRATAVTEAIQTPAAKPAQAATQPMSRDQVNLEEINKILGPYRGGPASWRNAPNYSPTLNREVGVARAAAAEAKAAARALRQKALDDAKIAAAFAQDDVGTAVGRSPIARRPPPPANTSAQSQEFYRNQQNAGVSTSEQNANSDIFYRNLRRTGS